MLKVVLLPTRSRLRQPIVALLGLLLLSVLIGLTACGGSSGSQPGSLARSAAARRAAERPAEVAHDPVHGHIARVVDGDTVDVRLDDGAMQRVRLIGIDTPEKYTTRTGYVECGGEQASALTRQIAARWQGVTLRPDRSQDAYDAYGRLLAYIQPDADRQTTYQQAILAAGWARVYVFDDHPFTRVSAFRQAAAVAKQSRLGVWQQCGGDFQRPLGN
jgi:micrococcal nuclease